MNTYWHKQTKDQPLFPDLVWSRPENRQHAGKLLIIGGNLHGFNAPAGAYAEAEKAGVGTARVILPDALQKTVSKIFPEAEYAPSTPSGSFAHASLVEMLEAANWSDGVLLAGNLGKNSETSMLLESFLQKYSGQLTLTGDSVDYFFNQPSALLHRAQTTLVLDFTGMQKIIANAPFDQALTSDLGVAQIADILHAFTGDIAANIVLDHSDTTYVATKGNLSTTPNVISPLLIASHTSTWWLQNPSKPFEALTTAALS